MICSLRDHDIHFPWFDYFILTNTDQYSISFYCCKDALQSPIQLVFYLNKTPIQELFLQSHFTEWLRLEGTSRSHLVQCCCSSSVTQSQLLRTMSWLLLSISEDGDSTTSLVNLCLFSVIPTAENVFPDVQKESPVSVCAYCSGSVNRHYTKKPASLFFASFLHGSIYIA